jgi:tRNA pseudouridine38-40 synthase
MRCIRLLVEYDGTDFHGWQVQPGVRTVQGELEAAVEKMTGARSVVRGASRTDAGVHAAGQVAQLHTESAIAAEQFAPGLTALSGPDVAVLRADEVPEGWSARFDARGKTYRYLLVNRRQPSPLHRRTCWHVAGALDVEAMVAAARHLVGRHDFATFRAAACDAETTVREMRSLDIRRREGEDIVELTFTATAFLQHMVRILVGTLVDVGRGRTAPDEVREIRDSLDRSRAGRTAPAHGLCLLSVQY